MCSEQNHFKRKCPNKQPPKPKHHEKRRSALKRRNTQINSIETRESDSSDELFLAIEQMHSFNSKRHTPVMNIQDQYIKFQLDDGSIINILPTMDGNHVKKSRQFS